MPKVRSQTRTFLIEVLVSVDPIANFGRWTLDIGLS